jgi:hypothetical protein
MSNRKVAIMLNFVEIQIDFCCLEVMGPYAEPGEWGIDAVLGSLKPVLLGIG